MSTATMPRYTTEWYDSSSAGHRVRQAAITNWIDTHLTDPPAHILDFGALTADMALHLAARYHAHAIAVDDADTLTPHDSIDTVHKRLGPAQIRKLPHQNITLCLSVLHHQPQWKNYLDALAAVSDVLFIETAHPDENLPTAIAHHKSGKIIAELERRGAEPLCTTPGYDEKFKRTLYVLTC